MSLVSTSIGAPGRPSEEPKDFPSRNLGLAAP
jgi:hypothetical protein